MDIFVDERDFKLLENDKYTFLVLRRVLGYDCNVILSDHERLIICHSSNPFPVWVWTPDDVTEAELENAYNILNETLPVSDGHTYNLKYELAEYIIKREAEKGKDVSIQINMFAYDCPEPIEPKNETDGEIHQCTLEDLDEIVEIMDLFHKEIGIDNASRDEYRVNAEEAVKSGQLYLWKNAEGRFVASCRYQPTDKIASINLVYTKEDARRKHYAEHLVYQVTKIAQDAGYIPMLYTNADYIASNACYEKIGYILRGKLCTIG